jgi:putative CocE/NonD family hydrolase
MKTVFSTIIWLLIADTSMTNHQLQNTLVASKVEYDIEEVLIEAKDGATISAIVVKEKGVTKALPVILQYTIYARKNDIESLKGSVDKGYIGVMAYSRGKYNSPDEIWPYENDANDAYEVIDWISKQKWSDGKVGMFGGSYNGFTQWAAAKKLHPALKTIVPYVANRPGMGLPMENNIFINPNYEWAFYVGNNRYLDTLAGNDRQRTRKMQNDWWESGVAYQKLDSIDGRPNKWFQRWISHPSFDSYWQRMAPYQQDFAQIDIPVLTIDGYYNDSQNSSLYYLREHYKYNPCAEHYLIIGPYTHFGAQRGGYPEVNGYEVDKAALINTHKITYQWFDYIFKAGAKPNILKDKINYQVMGKNEWRSASSVPKMSTDYLKLHLIDEKTEAFYSLKSERPEKETYLSQIVDFYDRDEWNNTGYYPDPIVLNELNTNSGYIFMSEPIQKSFLINGSFEGEIVASINKKDMDIGVTLYELMPNGQYFHLSYTIFRASYAKDNTTRQLLTPDTKEAIPIKNTQLVSKLLEKDSRIVVVLDVNKNPFSQLNYGTGSDVSLETIADAKEALHIKWFTSSFISIPIWRD